MANELLIAQLFLLQLPLTAASGTRQARAAAKILFWKALPFPARLQNRLPPLAPSPQYAQCLP
jgi:hypothetical protein